MRQCDCGCGVILTGPATKRYSSETCRKRVQRGGVAAAPVQPVTVSTSTVEAVRAELEAAGRTHTHLGAAALALAERIDAATAVMGFAALVKELRATMEAAVAGVREAADPVDELRARRDNKRAG